MSLFKKLFGNKNSHETQQEYVKADHEAIESLIRPLVKNATLIKVNKSESEPENSQLLSHFGGQPYFEEGESWPVNQNGRAMEFVFQVFNDSLNGIPKNIKLVQFFYDFEELAWENDSDGWKVKIYEDLANDKVIPIINPTDKPISYCEITFEKALDLPKWEGLDDLNPAIYEQLRTLLCDDDYEVYEEISTKITGNDFNLSNSLGGYPAWIQSAEYFDDSTGKPMDLLFQIDSEDNSDIMWGDAGIVYVFYDTNTKEVKFVMQSC